MIESILHFFSSIPGAAYGTIFYNTVLVLCLLTAFRLVSSTGNSLLYSKPSLPVPTIVVTVIIILFMGLRPNESYFGDTYMYAHSFNLMQNGTATPSTTSTGGEWLWTRIMFAFATGSGDVHAFFLVTDLLYYGLMLLCCWRLFPNNTWLAMLFFIGSFSTYSYGVNGIRNGVACSVVLVAIALAADGTKPERYAGLLLSLVAIAIHRSTALPIAALWAAVFIIRHPKQAIYFWIASIFLSLLVGNRVGDFFASLGFDDRMTSYFQGQNNAKDMAQFSHTGFRWDFLLYSAMPVLFTWYLTVKRNFNDRAFNIIAITYILANAFWILVIRAAFSNRFAYLSWFMYPLVIAYPLLRFNIWPDQDRKTALILLLFYGFTYLMYLIS
ncbi:EpsG family protein [Sodaliphilus pleomorphus]|uniref:EpsG family protein n=1 Tax=Sodaliphilus pleomorphus TaxID=2606626 RepID=A0A6L5XAB8_9BACT|nr:EpsG family protein [Sodaliphilus pleomorphus]MSS17349.1 EpsG family protein [Sodaliphilus pleomorphus]